MAELYIGNNQIGGGTPDLSGYYTKSEIDSSFGETYLVKISNASGYYCYVPRTMSDADRQIILSKLNANGAVVLTVPDGQALSNKIGSYSINTGYRTKASGLYSHAEGSYSEAKNWYSHAEGYFTCTSADYQHVEGKYNADASTAIKIVGNGNGNSQRHNALEVHLSGDVKISDTHATGEAYQKPMYVLQDKLYQIDSSITALEANSGTPDLTDYYTKSEVDDLIPTLPTALSSFTNDTGYITDNDISTFVTASTVYDKNYIDTSLNSIESRLNNSSSQQFISLEDYETLVDNDAVDENTLYYIQDLVDTSTLSELVNTSTLSAAINNATSALAPCEFVSLSEYQDMYDNNTVDSSKIYIISDLATQSDFSDFVSYSSLSALVNAVDSLKEVVTTESLILDSTRNITPELYIRDSTGNLYQLDIDELCQQFGTLVQG